MRPAPKSTINHDNMRENNRHVNSIVWHLAPGNIIGNRVSTALASAPPSDEALAEISIALFRAKLHAGDLAPLRDLYQRLCRAANGPTGARGGWARRSMPNQCRFAEPEVRQSPLSGRNRPGLDGLARNSLKGSAGQYEIAAEAVSNRRRKCLAASRNPLSRSSGSAVAPAAAPAQ